MALAGGKFQLASKLIDVALEFHIRRKNKRRGDTAIDSIQEANSKLLPSDSYRFDDL